MSEDLDDESLWDDLLIRIPPELKGYGPDIKRAVDAAIFKLRRNAHRGKWQDMTVEAAVEGLKGEVAELQVAIRNGNTLEILTESADCMNMSLIIGAIALEQRGV